MLEAGHFQRSIFDTLFPDGGLSYSLFCRSIRRFIKSEEGHDRKQKPVVNKPTPPSSVTSGTEKKPEAGKSGDGGTIGQFSYKLDPDTPIR